MFEYEFTDIGSGVLGVMPSGEKREFATEAEYHDAYTDEENEIIDAYAELHAHDEPIDYPEDWSMHSWLEYA